MLHMMFKLGQCAEKEELAGLIELHNALAGGTEVMAAFISMGKSGETPINSFIEAAQTTLKDVAGWRAKIEGVLSEAGVR